MIDAINSWTSFESDLPQYVVSFGLRHSPPHSHRYTNHVFRYACTWADSIGPNIQNADRIWMNQLRSNTTYAYRLKCVRCKRTQRNYVFIISNPSYIEIEIYVACVMLKVTFFCFCVRMLVFVYCRYFASISLSAENIFRIFYAFISNLFRGHILCSTHRHIHA